MIADGVVVSTDYELTGKTSDFGLVEYEDKIVVNDEDYTVRSVRKIDDGSMCIVSLSKEST